MTHTLRTLTTTTLTTLAALALTSSPVHADIRPIEPADTHTTTRPVITYAEPLAHGRLYFELSDGSNYRATPCQVEDSTNCYWDAAHRGNGQGRPGVNMAGRYLRIPVRFL